MKATLSALLCLSLAACGGSPKPAPTGPAPAPTGEATPAAPAAAGGALELGELKLVDVQQNKALLVHADGSIEIDGQKPAKVTKEGKIVRADNGQVGFTLAGDGSIKGPDGQDLGVTIGPDGTVKAGDKTISIDDSGNLVGGNPDAPAMRVEGATTPGLKRTAMFVLIALTAPGDSHESSGPGSAGEPATAPAPAPAPAPTP